VAAAEAVKVAGGEQMAYSQVYTQVQTVTVLQGDQVHCTALTHSLSRCWCCCSVLLFLLLLLLFLLLGCYLYMFVVVASLLCGSSGVLLRSAWRAWSLSRYNRPPPAHCSTLPLPSILHCCVLSCASLISKCFPNAYLIDQNVRQNNDTGLQLCSAFLRVF